MKRIIVDLNKTRRRRIAVWTPWGVVPIEKARKMGDHHPVRDKHDTPDHGNRAPERRLAG